ncbi:MAG TPA: hypothetical protein VFV78_11300 [Vicinamibacterales bacterium]|nr:hypothetical protein [Vicinamibacterales bacterium]
MLPECTVVGFSGHRSLADPAGIAARIEAMLDDLAATHGPLVATSSLAKGADAIFVKAALARSIPVLLVLPFPPSRFKHDFTPEEWRDVEPALAQAAHVEIVHGEESDDEAYMETGVRVVDDADVLVAVWDGKPTNGLGGTADVVAYARSMGRPLRWLNPRDGQIVVERAEAMPSRNGGVSAQHPGVRGQTPRPIVERHFSELDNAASVRAPKVRHLIQRIVWLQLVASLLALLALTFDLHGVWAYGSALGEVVVLGVAFAMTGMHHHRHAEWMKTRLEAEICRSFLATWSMRGRIGRPPQLAVEGFERITRRLRVMQLLDPSPPPPLEAARAGYLHDRIENQIEYFKRRSEGSRNAYTLLRNLALIGTGIAAISAATHVGLLFAQEHGRALTASIAVSLVMPLVSAALLSLVLTHEHARRAARYREMVELLQRAAHRLAAVHTWNGLTRVALETEDALLAEAVEWHSYRRFASEPH